METQEKLVEVYLHMNDIAPQFQGNRSYSAGDMPQKGDYVTLNEKMPEGPDNVARVLGVWHDSRRAPRIYVTATQEVFDEFRKLVQAPPRKSGGG